MTSDVLQWFSAPTAAWFSASFDRPTRVQQATWEQIATKTSVLVSAPTGSGKTLAAFLTAIDRLMTGESRETTSVLYISPLKALAYDVDRNLRAPLVGVAQTAARMGHSIRDVTVGIRSGDTSAAERRRLVKTPPDILITTPESLFLYLTAQARETLRNVDTVIVDEVHSVAGTKRGVHLALSLERLEQLRVSETPLQRIGLSATQRPLEEVATFLGGGQVVEDVTSEVETCVDTWEPRPVKIVDVSSEKVLDVEVIVPSALADPLQKKEKGLLDKGEPLESSSLVRSLKTEATNLEDGPRGNRTIWLDVHSAILDLVESHRSTIVFCNSRGLAERLCSQINDLAVNRWKEKYSDRSNTASAERTEPPVVARAHHGSVARDQRLQIEDALKSGVLPCVVATSSLELGIDMGAVDLVIQVASPGSVASGLQRIGRAGHHVGSPSVGKIFPKYQGDLVEAAVVTQRMLNGEIEYTKYPRNALDVLAQQIVAMAAMDAWTVQELWSVVRSAAPFADLSRTQLHGVLDMLSGRYPSDEFAELRPRLNWDRVSDTVTARRGAQRIAVTSGGTIPDRGLYRVFIAGDGAGRRVGELDEEMVYETRPGETIILGASTWRVEEITRDQVLVSPAPGEPGKLPFWHGDTPSRPIEVGYAVGVFLKELGDHVDTEQGSRIKREFHSRLAGTHGLSEAAVDHVVQYIAEQRDATGVIPSDRQIVVERLRDEVGDWRVCVLSPFGGRVHTPWALAIESRFRERFGLDVNTFAADDGIVLRLPDTEWDHQSIFDLGSRPDSGPNVSAGSWMDEATLVDLITIPPDEVEGLIVDEIANSPLFAARFREAAGRALLLPKRQPGRRTPLWQQRQRAADLLAVASRFGTFPIVLETFRECLQDVFDVPALRQLLHDVSTRKIRVTQVTTNAPSPFASSLLFGYVAGYLYEGDAPLAERRAAALTLDRKLLTELLGTDELRDLIDGDALEELELQLQHLSDDRLAMSADAVHDLLRSLGDLTTEEIAARSDGEVLLWIQKLLDERRIYRASVNGEQRWVAVEDAARMRDSLGVPIPSGVPGTFAEPVSTPVGDVVARFARTHGPFSSSQITDRLGLPRDVVDTVLKQLCDEGRVAEGAFRPNGSHREWIETGVLRRLRRRSLAALRREVEPVEPATFARFLPAWHGAALEPVTPGIERLVDVIEQLQGVPIPASILEHDVLASRVKGYQSVWLDELFITGEVVWKGFGGTGTGDGRVGLYLRDQAEVLLRSDQIDETVTENDAAAAMLTHLKEHGASFWGDLFAAARTTSSGTLSQTEAVNALWDLAWAGVVTNDSIAPLRALSRRSKRVRTSSRSRPFRRGPRRSQAPGETVGRWTIVDELVDATVTITERVAAQTRVMLNRHGVVARGTVVHDDVGSVFPGGFPNVYPVLKTMEDSGQVRRGYFVEGLGGAQFALPGAVDRLRSYSEPDDKERVETTVLAALDPAQPYGTMLPWPEPFGGAAPRRVAGAYVVSLGGVPMIYAGPKGGTIITFTEDVDELERSAAAFTELVTSNRVPHVLVTKIDGVPVSTQPLVKGLKKTGFSEHPRGFIYR